MNPTPTPQTRTEKDLLGARDIPADAYWFAEAKAVEMGKVRLWSGSGAIVATDRTAKFPARPRFWQLVHT